MNLVDLADQSQTLRAVLGKQLEYTEEVKVSDLDRKAALEFHCAALEVKRMAGDVFRIAEDLLVVTMGDERRATIDGTTIEVRRSYRRTDWEHSKVATHVAMRALGGEVIEGMDVVIDAFLKACNPSWRVTVLKEMGLDDTDYSERTLGRATVTLL